MGLKKRKQTLPSKAQLIAEVDYWKWQAVTLGGKMSPWLLVPGLIVYVNTDDLSDVEERIASLDLAINTLRKRAALGASTRSQPHAEDEA